jgi:DnaJ family protein C protein 8
MMSSWAPVDDTPGAPAAPPPPPPPPDDDDDSGAPPPHPPPPPPEDDENEAAPPPPPPPPPPDDADADADAAPPPPPPDDDDEEPATIARWAAERQQEEQAVGPSTTDPTEAKGGSSPGPADGALLRAFFSDLRQTDRENEVDRVLWAFKLNPLEQLNLPMDAIDRPDDVKRAYRKSSLMVHPDKCSHPRAREAFEVLGAAQRFLTAPADDPRLGHLRAHLNAAREQVRAQRRRETKADPAVALAATLHEKGLEGVHADWERSTEFEERWRAAARESLGKDEWRRRRLAKRLKEEEERVKGVAEEKRAAEKEEKEAEKGWEKRREERVGSWRDFQKKKGGGGGGGQPPSSSGAKRAKTEQAGGGGMAGLRVPQHRPEAKPADGGGGAAGSAAAGGGGGAVRLPPPPRRG